LEMLAGELPDIARVTLKYPWFETSWDASKSQDRRQ
jgi:hypothetical protein